MNFLVTSFSPPAAPNSSVKIEEEVEYDDNDDDYDDDDDYLAPTKLTNNLEAKSSSKIPVEATTEIPEKKSQKNYNINTDLDSKTFSQNSPTQKQAAVIIKPDNGFKLTQTQNGKTVKFPLSEQLREGKNPKADLESVPEGFNIVSDKKEAIVDLTASKVNPKIKYSTRYLPSRITDDEKNSITNHGKVQRPDSYVTVTKSLSGSLDENKNENGKFASTYYTKSSTCGFFTFSCNIVHGPNGKSKVCKPNKQANPKC